MAGFPEPEVGLVISYSYLWKEEEEQAPPLMNRTRPRSGNIRSRRSDPLWPESSLSR